ncbi:hypothetical protein OPT61_g10445 [Boeremia exigua]|uniref:Uncharacterized protein n=1 Tax=Boeremia exigua TaxID=749465 RepID=A0ACC2HR30_9PLEO|nr:hypothetical protein OPT61_g10445 [Boeremia exigua]
MTTMGPIAEPLAGSTPAPPAALTADEQTKYDEFLAQVRAWESLPVSSAKNAESTPLDDNERIWLTRECLLRYLRATKWNLAQSSTRLRSTAVWRRDPARLRQVRPTLLVPAAPEPEHQARAATGRAPGVHAGAHDRPAPTGPREPRAANRLPQHIIRRHTGHGHCEASSRHPAEPLPRAPWPRPAYAPALVHLAFPQGHQPLHRPRHEGEDQVQRAPHRPRPGGAADEGVWR